MRWIFALSLIFIFSCAKVDTEGGKEIRSEIIPLVIVTSTGDSITVYHFGMRGASDTTALDGIWHATMNDSTPFLWGEVPQGRYVLELHNMTGIDPIVLPITIKVYNSKGRP
jgi:hypothetical protein